MATKRPRYMISVSDEMFRAIEDFRFSHRYPTRSEATAELIRLGLEALAQQEGEHPGAYAAHGGSQGQNALSDGELADGMAALRRSRQGDQ